MALLYDASNEDNPYLIIQQRQLTAGMANSTLFSRTRTPARVILIKNAVRDHCEQVGTLSAIVILGRLRGMAVAKRATVLMSSIIKTASGYRSDRRGPNNDCP